MQNRTLCLTGLVSVPTLFLVFGMLLLLGTPRRVLATWFVAGVTVPVTNVLSGSACPLVMADSWVRKWNAS
jgi:hypothetical protein